MLPLAPHALHLLRLMTRSPTLGSESSFPRSDAQLHERRDDAGILNRAGRSEECRGFGPEPPERGLQRRDTAVHLRRRPMILVYQCGEEVVSNALEQGSARCFE